MTRSPLAYVPGSSPLHRTSPGNAAAFLGALAAIAFAVASPLVLTSVAGSACAVGLLAGARRAVGAALRLALPLVALMVAVNALVTDRGDTVLVRGWELPVLGATGVTLESLAAGAAIGLRVGAAILVFALYSACVDPDRVMRALRPLAGRSALTAALVTRLVPVAGSDLARLREAAALRGPGAEPVGRGALARRLVAGSLDRAVDIAATLELRGHSLPAPRLGREGAARDPRLLAATAVLVAAGVAAAIGGAGRFETYPRLELALDPGTLAFALAIPALATAPFLGRRDG